MYLVSYNIGGAKLKRNWLCIVETIRIKAQEVGFAQGPGDLV